MYPSKQASNQAKERHQCSVISHWTSVSSMNQAHERLPPSKSKCKQAVLSTRCAADNGKCHQLAEASWLAPGQNTTVLESTQDPGLGQLVKTYVLWFSGVNSRGGNSTDS